MVGDQIYPSLLEASEHEPEMEMVPLMPGTAKETKFANEGDRSGSQLLQSFDIEVPI
jgi:hypothetical protein